MLDTIIAVTVTLSSHVHHKPSAAFHKLAVCESTNNPKAINPSHRYFGLFQFDLTTWHSLGYSGNPIQHSRATQTAAAVKLHNKRGWTPWPYCSRKLGLK
jgi:hypothetical protein